MVEDQPWLLVVALIAQLLFPGKPFFTFGSFGSFEIAFVEASFPWETSFPFNACVGSEVAFVVPMLAS